MSTQHHRIRLQRPDFASLKAYSEHFTDAEYWRPYVQAVCARHSLAPCDEIKPGLPGTNPVFLVDGRYAVKFYTHLFGGADSFPIERELYALFASAPRILAPALVAHGELFLEQDAWPWPYIITQVVPGTSLGEVRDKVAYGDKVALAEWLGLTVRRLHELSLHGLLYLAPAWDTFVSFLSKQRAACAENQRQWQAMPERLVAEIDAYLPSIEALVDEASMPCLLHGDLNEDHVLGAFEAGHWRPTGIIDFGDAKVGDRMYELVALHIGLFCCDKHLLRTFLESYGWSEALKAGFAFRAMSYTLLFEFNVLGQILEEFPIAREVESLEALARLLWDLTYPGLPGRDGR